MIFVRPPSLAAALTARVEHPDYVALAGATDFLVGASKRPEPPGVIDLYGLAELVGVRALGDVVRIGAATPYVDILASDVVSKRLPMLRDCVREIGATQIQQRGTIGGNVATSSPVGDTLPVLLALNATIEVASAQGTRVIAYDDFCTGYRQTALAPDELMVAVTIPLPSFETRQLWRKIGTRGAQSIAKVSVAATAKMGDGVVKAFRLAMGAVAAQPIRLPVVEEMIVGQQPNAALGERAAAAVEAAITPLDDVRSSAFYRRKVAGNVTRRFVLSLAV